MSQRPLIAPSILAADFARLGDEVAAIIEAGADWIHLDVMDGHFVPNISFGPAVIKALRPRTKAVFDCHLMIEPVDPLLAAFADAGADIITIHADATKHLDRSLQAIRIARVKAKIGRRDIRIEVDGGITAETAALVSAAGADVLVAGSAVFSGGSAKYRTNIESIRGAAIAALAA